MKAPDLDRIRYVTRHLGDLQASVRGSWLVGLMVLFQGMGSYSGSLLWTLPQLASLLGFAFVKGREGGYLEARFGRVEKKMKWKTLSDRAQGWIFLGGLLLFILLFGYVLFVMLVLHSPKTVDFFFGRLMYLGLGVAFLHRWTSREYRLAEAYNLGIAALFLAICTGGAFPALTPPAWLWNSGMPLILSGSALIFSSLVDYWQLARTLPPIAEESEALETEETR